MLNRLFLVYPPVSNQLADWLWEDEEVREMVKHSKLYMIAQRQELLFENIRLDSNTRMLHFDLCCGNVRSRDIIFPTTQFEELNGNFTYDFDASPRHIRFVTDKPKERCVRWFSPDSFLYAWWRNKICLRNPPDVRSFTNFDLHYVGISKESNSFARLFQNGHENRAKILTNAQPIVRHARVSDEVMLFLFDVEPIGFKVWGFDEYGASESAGATSDPTPNQVISDAEKAFIKVLKSEYNKLRYSSYPAGADGLGHLNLHRYGYIIDEPLTFHTLEEHIRGGDLLNTEDPPDMIAIEGGSVQLMRFAAS